MANKLYYDENTKRFISLKESNIITEDEYNDFNKKYDELVKANLGFMSVETNKLVYVEYKTYIRADDKYGTWQVIQKGEEPKAGFTDYELSSKDVFNATNLKNAGNIVLYYQGAFKSYTLAKDEVFDYDNKKIVLNVELVRNEIMGNNFNVDEMVKLVTSRGFPITISGKEYYQPFNSIDDTIYFISLLVSNPEDRILKLWYKRDPYNPLVNAFDIAKGAMIDNSLLERFLYLIRAYAFYVRDVCEVYYEDLLKLKTRNELQAFKNTFIDNIISYIKTNYIDKDTKSFNVLDIVELKNDDGKGKKPNETKSSKETVKAEEKQEDKPNENKEKETKKEDHSNDNKDKENHSNDNEEKEKKNK